MKRLRTSAACFCFSALVWSCSSGAQSTDLHLDTTTTEAPAPSTTTTVASTTMPATTTTSIAETTTTEPPTTTTEPPTTTTTNTIEPTTTVPAPSTEFTTTTSVTTETTVAVDVSPEDQVRADYQSARLARLQCIYDPVSCAFDSIAITGSPTDVDTRRGVQERIDQNIRGKPGFGEIKLRIDQVTLGDSTAFVYICVFDAGVLFDIQDPSNPDDDIIQDDSKFSYRVIWEMHQNETGRWLFYQGVQTQKLVDGDLCGF